MKKQNDLVEILKNVYPSLVCEKDGEYEVDLEKLKLELGKGSDIINEGYSLNWLGQSYSRVIRDCPTTTLIKPDNKHNQLKENINSNNVYIEGDNLEVLKHLKNAYSSKIKMIYIDPPYNTGSDGFVYNDSFNFDVETFMRLSGLDKEEAEKVLNYNKAKRNSHSAWLTFMYPRLYIARELLKDDGVIFISIDDNEQAQLKLLCDQIFGEENFIGQIIIKVNAKKQKIGKPTIGVEHEYILCYSKSQEFNLNYILNDNYSFVNNYFKDYTKIRDKMVDKQTLNKKEIDLYVKFSKIFDQNKGLKNYKYIDENGLFRSDNINMNLGSGNSYKIFDQQGNQLLPPKHGWPAKTKLGNQLFDEKEGNLYIPIDEQVEEYEDGKFGYGNLIWGENTITYCKTHLDSFTKLSSLITNFQGSDDAYLRDIIFNANNKFFDYPKIKEIIMLLIQFSASTDDTCLDFFSGSGTTADAVMRQCVKDGHNRKFIMVQLPEEIDEKNFKEAYEFCTKELKQEPIIPTIAKERIKRAANKIKEENKDKEYIDNLDLGFKVYKTIEDDRTDVSQLVLFDVKDGIKTNVDDLEALLTTWMLHDGYDLNTNVEEIMINKYKGYLVEQTLYLLDKGFSTEDLLLLVDKLNDPKTPLINQIILNSSNFGNKVLQEFHENVFSKNSKEAKIVVEDR